MTRIATFLPPTFFLLISLFASLPSALADAPVEDGTAASPWLVRNADDLRAVEEKRGDYFRLAENIELSGEWTPLCESEPFEGTFDGAGRTISGLNVNARKLAGLFARIGEKGRVCNVKVTGTIMVGAESQAAGGIAARNAGVVTRATSRIAFSVASDAPADVAVGGLVGTGSGIVAFCEFDGTLEDSQDGSGTVGAIVGVQDVKRAVGRLAALPKLFTAHAGFAAKGGARDQREDNTLASIVKALRFRPDVVEVDVRLHRGKTLVITHNTPTTDQTPTLESALRILMGELPPELEGEEFNPEQARKTKIQLDAKQDGLVGAELELVERIGFPLDRVLMAGDSRYETVLKDIERIRAAVDQGMEFWMNPDRIASYDDLKAKSSSFLERIKKLNLPRFTVNSYYGAITPDVEEWLRANGLQISMWTLNDATAIEQALIRGAYNVTSRLPAALTAREECARRGVYGCRYDSSKYRDVGRELTE